MAKFVELMLTVLQFQAEGLFEIGDILFSTPAETRRWFHRIPTYQRQWFKTSWAERYRDRQQFHRTLQYLKRQGLVVKRNTEGSVRWALTKRGSGRLQQYRQSRTDPFSRSHINFEKPKGGGITIVTFDIPEKERRKRDWLRVCLAEMGFTMLQKSVWMAKGAAMEDFIHALRNRELLDYVYIFMVTRQGTVKTV